MPPALEAKSPNHWTTREVPLIHFKVYFGRCSFRSLNFKICYWTFKPFCLLRKRNQGWGWCSMIQSQLLSYVRIFWETVSCSVVFDSLQPHRLQPTRLLCPRDFPGKNTGVGCYFFLQEIFPTQGLNLGLLHCRQMPYHLSHQSILISRNTLKFWK